MIISNITETDDALKGVTQNNYSLLSEFFQSILHMHINRMFVSNQRLFEMITYDYLFRHYKTIFNMHSEIIKISYRKRNSFK